MSQPATQCELWKTERLNGLCLARLELWDRLATPAAHYRLPVRSKGPSQEEEKARAEAQAWAAAAASAPAEPALSAPLTGEGAAAARNAAGGEAEANARELAASLPAEVGAVVAEQRAALLDGADGVVPLSTVWGVLKALLLRCETTLWPPLESPCLTCGLRLPRSTELPSALLVAAKEAVASHDSEMLVDTAELVMELLS